MEEKRLIGGEPGVVLDHERRVRSIDPVLRMYVSTAAVVDVATSEDRPLSRVELEIATDSACVGDGREGPRGCQAKPCQADSVATSSLAAEPPLQCVLKITSNRFEVGRHPETPLSRRDRESMARVTRMRAATSEQSSDSATCLYGSCCTTRSSSA